MNQEELKLLRKYLRGNATPEEEQYIRHWLIAHEDDENVRQLLQEEWVQTSSDNEFDINMHEAWSEFKQKIHSPLVDIPVNPARRKPASSWRPLMFMATVAMVMVVSSIFVFRALQPADPQTQIKEEVAYSIKKTNRGEKLNITLPDGSFIKLNSSSELQIPDDYNTSHARTVYLEGEAFFEIARDERRPFRVVSGKIITEVLGTSFNVNTISHSDEVNVAVVTGKVRVVNDNNEIVLFPKEMTTVGSATSVPVKNSFDVDLITGWKNNLLVFEKVSFDEIIEKIEQWYGVDVIIEGNVPQTGRYSGRFENKSLQLVLEGLGFSSAFEFEIVDKTVYLKFN